MIDPPAPNPPESANPSITIHWNSEYVPHQPQPKQLAFLMLPHKEAFYGGAAGGGKSDALLMAALQYVDIPGYSAIVFRRTLSELKLSGALLDRAHSWLSGKRCTYVAGEHTYYFPTVSPWGGYGEPAKLAFGYMGQESAKARYQSAEYQFAGFDELTHYPEADYLWLFSRLRKVTCSHHPKLDHEGSPVYEPGCPECEQKRLVPVRLRAASNPGNIGHKWVKERFRIEPVQRDGEVLYIGNHPERPFIPATVTDNQFVDQKAYIEGLNELDPLTRAQMKKGDWGASLDARYKAHWFADRRYYRRGDYYVLGNRGTGFLRGNFLKVFTVIDPAASGREGPGDMDRFKKPGKSWTVLTTFGLTEDYNLLVLDMVRVYVEAPEILRLAKNVYKAQHPSYIICEAAGVGKAIYQTLSKAGLPVKPVYPHQDKVMRATDSLIRAEKGQIWLPAHPGPAWLRDLEEELFTWIGHPHETDDIIDTISYAATDVSWEAAGEELGSDPDLVDTDLTADMTPEAFPNAMLSSIEDGSPSYHNPSDYSDRY